MIKDSCNYNLLRHNTFGMNVKCARFLEFSTIDDLREITSQRDIVDKPMLILGGGSNVLFVGDFPGTILHSGIKGIELILRQLLGVEGADMALRSDVRSDLLLIAGDHIGLNA